jgi:hypothetical protein
MALPDAPIALRRKRLAAAVSRLAVSRKSIICPVESSARYRYLSSPLDYSSTRRANPIQNKSKQNCTRAQQREIAPEPNKERIPVSAACRPG